MRRLNFRQYLEAAPGVQGRVPLIGSDDPTVIGHNADATMTGPQRTAPAAPRPAAPPPKPTPVLGHDDPLPAAPAAPPRQRDDGTADNRLHMGRGEQQAGANVGGRNDPMLALVHRFLDRLGARSPQDRQRTALRSMSDAELAQVFGPEAERFKRIGLLRRMGGGYRLDPDLARRYGLINLR